MLPPSLVLVNWSSVVWFTCKKGWAGSGAQFLPVFSCERGGGGVCVCFDVNMTAHLKANNQPPVLYIGWTKGGGVHLHYLIHTQYGSLPLLPIRKKNFLQLFPFDDSIWRHISPPSFPLTLLTLYLRIIKSLSVLRHWDQCRRHQHYYFRHFKKSRRGAPCTWFKPWKFFNVEREGGGVAGGGA
jgi:hypothetical protein